MSLRTCIALLSAIPLVFSAGCITTSPGLLESPTVERVLDDWHRAAARADGARYFGAFTADAVFMGTDATERWTVEEFRAYAAPHFSKGDGWEYEAHDRHLRFSSDGRTVWIDERLRNAKYGDLRGTGVLVRSAGEWKIAHYSMSFPIPNEVTVKVVEQIRAAGAD
ncbi:MAG: ketosteroid isomerase-like protein [Chlamydiales bacterium]|jgi:ketosteroid isomerase-like protein